MRKPKAVVFDLDGMIMSGVRFSERLEREHGITRETTSSFFGGPFQNCLVGRADLLLELDRVLPSWGWKGTREELLSYWFDPVENVINENIVNEINTLTEIRIPCYLATNNEKYRVRNVLETRRLGSSFDGVFASCAMGFKKPDEKYFEAIAHEIGLSLEDIIFFDDDIENVDAADKFGFSAYLYTTFDQFYDDLESSLDLD